MRKGLRRSRERVDGRERRRRKKVRKKVSLFKIFLFIIASALLPFSASLVVNMPHLFRAYASITPQMLWVIGGFVLFLLVFTFFGAPVKSYILEHELSHVVFALFSGVRVYRVSMKSRNAYVRTDRINILIALAPYSLPLYTVILVAMYRLLNYMTTSMVLASLFYFLFGATLSFHFVATIHYIQLEQPDLRRYGYFASLVFIATWSLLILTILLRLIFPDIQLQDFLKKSLRETYQLYGKAASAFIRFFT